MQKISKPSQGAESESKTSWEDLTGYDQELQRLKDMITNDRLPPVILFGGREGCGKKTFALAAAALLFCRSQSACGTCGSCEEISQGEHPDVLCIHPEKQRIRTESAGEAQEHLSLRTMRRTPGGPERKVLIMTDVDLMTPQAANRLLKTLEEPPVPSAIFMTTGRKKSLLPTILSRVVVWNLRPPAKEDSIRLLKQKIPALTGREVREEALHRCLERYGLAPGRVIQSFTAESQVLEQQTEQLRQALCSGNDTGAALSLCEKLSREWKWPAADLVREAEIILCHEYREAARKSAPLPSPHVIKRRRELLSSLNRMVLKSRINLNTQLASEALSIAGRMAGRD